MSGYDVGIWYCPADLSDAQAADYYQRLNSRVVVVEYRPEFDAFLREVIARFPDRAADDAPVNADDVHSSLLMTFDDLKTMTSPAIRTPDWIAKSRRDFSIFEGSPWASTLSANGASMELSFRWSRADEYVPVVLDMARQHGLTIYDAQRGRVINPNRPATQSATDFLSVHLTLRLAGQPPAVDVILVQDGQTVLHTTMPDRASAHAAARQVATLQRDRAYEVDDPRSLAQGTRLVPASPRQGLLTADMLERFRARGFTVQTLEGPDGPVAPSSPAAGATGPAAR